MFDLEGATDDWVGDLRRSGSHGESDLEGLRASLKEEAGQLRQQGLSASEAFWVARSRLEVGKALPEQYARSGARAVWRDRFRWIGVGILAFLVFNCVIGLLSLAAATLAAAAGIESYWLLFVSVSVQVLFTGGCLLAVFHILPGMKRLGIASAYERVRRSWAGSAVLYVIFVALAVLLTLSSWEGELWELELFDLGALHLGQSFINAHSETSAAHFFLSVPIAIALVSILFVLGRRKQQDHHVRAER